MIRISQEFIAWLNAQLEADEIGVELIDAEKGIVAVRLPGGQPRRQTVESNLELGMLMAAMLDMVRSRPAMKAAYTTGRMCVPEPLLRIAAA